MAYSYFIFYCLFMLEKDSSNVIKKNVHSLNKFWINYNQYSKFRINSIDTFNYNDLVYYFHRGENVIVLNH